MELRVGQVLAILTSPELDQQITDAKHNKPFDFR